MTDEIASAEFADVGRQHIGNVYGKALLGAVASDNDTPDNDARQVLDQFQAVVRDVLDPNPALRAIFASPRLSPDDKAGIIDRVLGDHVHPVLLRFLHVVGRHGRLDCLRDIYRAARQQFNAAHGIVEVLLTTADTLDGGLAENIRTALSVHLSREVDLVTKVDPRLIGGMVVRVGDTVYDASVAHRLESMRKDAVDRAVQQMKESADRFVVSAG